MRERAKVTIEEAAHFSESYNSPFRATVHKLVDEKYARKLVQDYLKSKNIYGATVNKLYTFTNGINSKQTDKWVFGITYPLYSHFRNMIKM